jgi:protein-disulfide isomerase
MHDKLFANQASLSVADLKRYAAEVGLNAEAFNQCLDSSRYARKWRQDQANGALYGITGTPTFFVNGRMLTGAVPLQDFDRMIQEELNRTDAASSARTIPTVSEQPTERQGTEEERQ